MQWPNSVCRLYSARMELGKNGDSYGAEGQTVEPLELEPPSPSRTNKFNMRSLFEPPQILASPFWSTVDKVSTFISYK